MGRVWSSIDEIRALRHGTLVFTNGCFGVLHAGHLELLRVAATLGDMLVVAVNSDRSYRRCKGRTPPMPQASRAAALAAVPGVTGVVVFDDDTPEALIREITPDVLVKGDDYEGQRLAGADWVEAHGGRVVLVPRVVDPETGRPYATRDIVGRCRR